jgi:hypothetical protein
VDNTRTTLISLWLLGATTVLACGSTGKPRPEPLYRKELPTGDVCAKAVAERDALLARTTNCNTEDHCYEDALRIIAAQSKALECLEIEIAVPIGAVLAFAVQQAPNDRWLECNGTDIKKSDYQVLCSKLGTTYGAGRDENWCRLPDYRGRFLRAADDGSGRDQGPRVKPDGTSGPADPDRVGTTQDYATAFPKTDPFTTIDEVPQHSHEGIVGNGRGGKAANGGTPHPLGDQGIGPGPHHHDVRGGDKETRPVNISVRYYIRAK